VITLAILQEIRTWGQGYILLVIEGRKTASCGGIQEEVFSDFLAAARCQLFRHIFILLKNL
jgi:hypothetical protein